MQIGLNEPELTSDLSFLCAFASSWFVRKDLVSDQSSLNYKEDTNWSHT